MREAMTLLHGILVDLIEMIKLMTSRGGAVDGLLPRKCWVETTELGRQEFVFWPRTIMMLHSIFLVSVKSWNLTMRVGLLSCITIGGALAGDHGTRLLRSGECVDEFRFQKEDTSGITFLVMQRSLAFSLGSGDPSVNRDQNSTAQWLVISTII